MGCDIHIMTEVKVRRKDMPEGVWANADKWSVDPWVFAHKDDMDIEEYKAEYLEIHYDDKIYRGRDYALFGLLAGVRDDSVTPISPPKGVPIGCSPEYMRSVDNYGSDGHSHSYLTLEELEAVNWEERIVKESFILHEAADKIPVRNIIKRENRGGGYAKVEHYVPLKDFFEDFYTRTLFRLEILRDRYGMEKDDIRIVFFFDN